MDDFEGCIHKLRKVSVLNLDLVSVNMVVQVSDKDVMLKATTREITKEERGNDDFTKYMNRLDSGEYHRESVRLRKGQEDKESTVQPSRAMLRFASGPSAEKLCESAGERGYIQLQLSDIDLNFLKSSLTNISSLMQDELDADPVPLDITIFNSAVTLLDDAPLVYPDTITPPPLQLRIPSVKVQRTPDGTFHVKGIHPQGISLKPTPGISISSSSSSSSSPWQLGDKDRSVEATGQLTRNTAAMATLQDENVSLRRQRGLMNDALAVLERERTSLLSTLEHLQEELLTADRERDKLKENIVELSRRVNLGR